MLSSISGNSGKLGERLPAVWTHTSQGDTNSRALHICSGVDTNSNYCYNSKLVVKNQWHSLTVEQKLVNSKYIYSVYVNGKLLHTKENTNPRIYQNVKLYISDPWYSALDGQIKDLKVESSKGKSTFS